MKQKEYNTICGLILEKICGEKSKNYFFESVIGCELDFLECIDREFHCNDVYIRVLIRGKDENDISEVLKIRNNNEIKKCIILTNRSLKDIDSLKDIGEDTFDSLTVPYSGRNFDAIKYMVNLSQWCQYFYL